MGEQTSLFATYQFSPLHVHSSPASQQLPVISESGRLHHSVITKIDNRTHSLVYLFFYQFSPLHVVLPLPAKSTHILYHLTPYYPNTNKLAFQSCKWKGVNFADTRKPGW